jgi:hypothetical protein
LEEIADVIKGSELVEITTDRFRFDTIAELVEKCADQHFSELKINTYVPHLSVRLGPDSNNLACVARTTQDTGGFYRIDALLKRASLKPSIAFSPSGAAWILGAYGLFLFLLLMLNTWSGFVPNRTGIYFTFVGLAC